MTLKNSTDIDWTFDGIEIQHTLVLSTAHLPYELAREWDCGVHRELPVDNVEYGYNLYVGLPDHGDERKNWHPALLAAARLAWENDCTRVLYDCDGPKVEQLKDYLYYW